MEPRDGFHSGWEPSTATRSYKYRCEPKGARKGCEVANDRPRLSEADLIESYASRIARQSYGSPALIEGVRLDEPKVHRSTDGTFAELLRIEDDGNGQGVPGFRPRQWSWSLMEPGAVKAWHLHLA